MTSSLHEYYIAPDAVALPDSFPNTYYPEAAFLVKLDAGDVLLEYTGL